nr:abortive infection system antitoxin AbiGi family protein [Ningiella sp. W23]
MIIHFTKKFEFLNSILDSKSFRLKYCCEYIGDEKGKIVSNAAHPIVSFSEFDDNELEHKKVTYGRYGIALKKIGLESAELAQSCM